MEYNISSEATVSPGILLPNKALNKLSQQQVLFPVFDVQSAHVHCKLASILFRTRTHNMLAAMCSKGCALSYAYMKGLHQLLHPKLW